MKEETTTILVFTIIVIQTSLAVEMDIFAGPFVHRRDQEIKNERPIIGTLAFSKENISYTLDKNYTMALFFVCRFIRCPTNMSRRLHHANLHAYKIFELAAIYEKGLYFTSEKSLSLSELRQLRFLKQTHSTDIERISQ